MTRLGAFRIVSDPPYRFIVQQYRVPWWGFSPRWCKVDYWFSLDAARGEVARRIAKRDGVHLPTRIEWEES